MARVQAACDNTDTPWNRGRAPAEGCGKSKSLGGIQMRSLPPNSKALRKVFLCQDLAQTEIPQVVAEHVVFCLVVDVATRSTGKQHKQRSSFDKGREKQQQFTS